MEDDTVKSAEYCRTRVEESERLAAEANDPERKVAFHELADRWRRLAEESKSDALKPVGGKRRRPGADLTVGIDRQRA